jgi:hypothetical protein
MKIPVVGSHPQLSAGNIQPLLLFLMGMGFTALGFIMYPAFIGVGALFIVIGYRGYTCRRGQRN